MIDRILVIAQGPGDLGFLKGLCARFGCRADFVDYRKKSLLRQRGNYTLRKDARLIWEVCKQVGAALIVRLTDGDTDDSQNVIRRELERFPEEARSMPICGVCDRDTEHWMCLDPHYVAGVLQFDPADLPQTRKERSGFVKNAVERCRGGRTCEEFVEAFVREAPSETLRQWLENPAFSVFHDECRRQAARHNCEVANFRD